ncbi:unnamed protein product [Soboliphyme baturini]|uniref:Mitotic spindle assembly checkpoint protein MAD2A n=1 Tax=Soboliphyme baturini TaxID=241478 RepID=A0A183ICR8_9BILA|nr:unnamed protein product [Soboliphyme baturini]
MTAQEVATTAVKSSITLRGSAEMVGEFFYFGINSILFQRGVYHAESFKKVQKYGLTVLVTKDCKLDKFFKPLLDQIRIWLIKKQIRKLVMVIVSVQTKETLERWEFDIETDDDITEEGTVTCREKSQKIIQNEIRDVIRQITASVTFLPLLEELCSFDILIYAKKDSETPEGWGLVDAHHVKNCQVVKLNSFSTNVHKVEMRVSYKNYDS